MIPLLYVDMVPLVGLAVFMAIVVLAVTVGGELTDPPEEERGAAEE